MIEDARKIVDKLNEKLPSTIYDDSDYAHIYWNHSYQRKDTSKKLAIFTIEQEIKILESIRGENIAFHNGDKTIPLETKIKDLFQLIKEIKEL